MYHLNLPSTKSKRTGSVTSPFGVPFTKNSHFPLKNWLVLTWEWAFVLNELKTNTNIANAKNNLFTNFNLISKITIVNVELIL